MKYFVGSSQVLIEKMSQDRFRVDSITMSIRRKSSETDEKMHETEIKLIQFIVYIMSTQSIVV